MSFFYCRRCVLAAATGLISCSAVRAQQAVPIGKGSYADGPPPASHLGEIENNPIYLVKHDDRPLPSNHWWTQLLVTKFAKSLWSVPLRVDTSAQGMDIFFPTAWSTSGNDPACKLPLRLGGADFHPVDSRANTWSDWLVSFQLHESADKYINVTLGEGMPYVWAEYHGVVPSIDFAPGEEPTFFSLNGVKATLPVTSDCIGIHNGDHNFAVFAPDGTTFSPTPGGMAVAFAGSSQYLVVCPLSDAKDIDTFHHYAYAIPRDTQYSYSYDPQKGLVNTTWKVVTETLKGTEHKVIQGWIPHHYRHTENDLQFCGLNYLSPRGPMKCAIGDTFHIAFPYTGILPNLPAPKKIGGEHDYDPGRMHTYLSELAAKPKFGADTYWGGKDILRFGQCALMAQQTQDDNYATFCTSLRAAMNDWFSFSPRETEHFFTYYPHWKALVGAKASYGSEAFNDHHFHYGYFTFASALLAMHDSSFVAEDGAMATLVAKEYANWDRTDARFPRFRTFDIWAGHSWAGGTSSPGGNNQESSSEAVQSWAGLIYLGKALGDRDMEAAGVMGYATETQATLEYWFNDGGDVFPAEWKHPIAGMVWSGGKVYGTYFSGDPAWVFGIQWLPASPMLSYLVHDPEVARRRFGIMLAEHDAHEKADAARAAKAGKTHVIKPATIKSFGPGLGSVMLGYVLMYDPQWVAGQLDDLWNEPQDKIAHSAAEMTVMYYQAHAMRSLGKVDWTIHGSSSTSMVYIDDKGVNTYIAWNPRPKEEKVTFYKGQTIVGTMVAPGKALTSVNHL